jgi:hypothetical protein
MSKLYRFAACAGALALAATLPVAAQNIDAKEYWLDNGMQVLMVERHEAPTIMASIFARVGSSNETTGITGISHLFEHMMFKGTETIGTKDIERDREIMARLDELRAQMREEERIMRERLRRGEIEDMMVGASCRSTINTCMPLSSRYSLASMFCAAAGSTVARTARAQTANR